MQQFPRYLAAGLANTAFGYAVIFACMYGLGLSPEASNVVGYAIGIVTSYALNRTFTFRSAGRKLPEFVRFVAIFLLSFAANFMALKVLLRIGVHPVARQVIAGAIYVGTSYLLSRSFVFRQTRTSRAR